MSMNVVVVSGIVATDPVVKDLKNSKVANFRLAIQKDRKDDSGKKPSFFTSVTAWGKDAEFIEKYASKGSRIEFTGKLDENEYKTSEGVEKKEMFLVISFNGISSLTAPKGDGEKASPKPSGAKEDDSSLAESYDPYADLMD